MLESADAPRKALLNSEVAVHAIVFQAGTPNQTFDMKVYIGSAERELVVFTGGKERGRKFLMSGNKTWLLVPGSKHPIAISPNQRMAGSFSFSDLARIRLSADFTGTLRAQAEACGVSDAPQTCNVIDVTAKSRSAPYASGTLWIDTHGVLRRAVFALPSGKPAKQVEYHYRRSGGALMLSEMEITDMIMPLRRIITRLEYGEKHSMRLSDQEFEPEYALTH